MSLSGVNPLKIGHINKQIIPGVMNQNHKKSPFPQILKLISDIKKRIQNELIALENASQCLAECHPGMISLQEASQS